MTTFKKGDIVRYKWPMFPPIQSSSPLEVQITDHTAVIDEPFELGGKPAYRLLHVAGSVPAEDMELAPTIFCSDGKWRNRIDFDKCGFNVRGEIYWNDIESQFKEIGWRYSVYREPGSLRRALPIESYEAARAAVEELCK